MNGYVTPNRLSRVLDIPISFAQTELRRGKYIQIAQIPIELNQRLHVRGLVIHCVKNLTPGISPVYATTSLGTVSVGVYFGSVLTSPLALAYVLNQPFPTFPLIGPRVLAETRISFKALEVGLSPQDLAWLNLEA